MPSGKHGNHARGVRNGRWNSTGKIISSHGYVKVRVGRDHPLADPNGYAYEHTLVLAAAGILLGPNHVAHHRNGNKTDNRLANLEVKTRGHHALEHIAERTRDEHGRITERLLPAPRRDTSGRYVAGGFPR